MAEDKVSAVHIEPGNTVVASVAWIGEDRAQLVVSARGSAVEAELGREGLAKLRDLLGEALA